MLGENCTY